MVQNLLFSLIYHLTLIVWPHYRVKCDQCSFVITRIAAHTVFLVMRKTLLWCVVGFVDSDVDSLAFRVPRSTKRRHIYSTSGFHWIHMRRRDIGFILYWAVLYVLIQHRAAVCRTAIERHSVCLSVCLCVCVCVCVWQCYTGSLLGGRVHVLCRTTLDRGIMRYIVVYCIRYRD